MVVVVWWKDTCGEGLDTLREEEGGTLKNCLRVGVSASPVREILPRRMETCGEGGGTVLGDIGVLGGEAKSQCGQY